MNRTIDEQLSRLESIKVDLKSAINYAYGSNGLTSNKLVDFVSFIRNNLTKKTTTQFTVSFNKNGGSGTTPAAQTVNSGATITLPTYTGTKTGYTQIAGWATSSSATTPTYQFGDAYTVTHNATLYAVFVQTSPATHKVIWSNPQSGGTITGKVGTTTITSGTEVQVGATVKLTYNTPSNRILTSISWTGHQLVENLTTQQVTFTMPNEDVDNITALVVLAQAVTLTVTSNNSAWGSVSGGGTFAVGSTRTITATPNNGYVFVSWNDGDTDASRQVVLDGDMTFTATFAESSDSVEVHVLEFVCPNPTENSNTCYSSIGIEDFSEYYIESTIDGWFDATNLKIKASYQGTEYDFGVLRQQTYSTNNPNDETGDGGYNIENSYAMYWIAVPNEFDIDKFYIPGIGAPQDIKNQFNVDEKYKKFENVELNDNKYYNVYGMWTQSYLTGIHLTFVQNN